MSAKPIMHESNDSGKTPQEPTSEFYCTYCRATRECITCWHGRMLREAEASDGGGCDE